MSEKEKLSFLLKQLQDLRDFNNLCVCSLDLYFHEVKIGELSISALIRCVDNELGYIEEEEQNE